jgi:hypothetical protein
LIKLQDRVEVNRKLRNKAAVVCCTGAALDSNSVGMIVFRKGEERPIEEEQRDQAR